MKICGQLLRCNSLVKSKANFEFEGIAPNNPGE